MRKRAKLTIALAFLSSSLLMSCQEAPPLKENPPAKPDTSQAGESYGKGGLGEGGYGEDKAAPGAASSGRPSAGAEVPKGSEPQ